MNNRTNQLGWVVAALLAGLFAATGFNQAESKIGVVDIAKVVESSEFGKAGQQEFAARKAAREGILEFIDQYRVLTLEQANDLKNLSLLPNPTAEEKSKLERIKSEVIASAKKSQELALKASPTAEDRTMMDEYAKRSQAMEQMANKWLRDFTNELQIWADDHKLQSLTRAKAALQEVSKTQGYTVVFEVSMAPYGANDVSDATLKAMNARK